MPPVKVMFILDEFPGCNGGTESQFWALLNGLDRQEVVPAVVVLRPSEFLQANLQGTPYFCLNIMRLRSPYAWWKAFRFAAQLRWSGYDLCHLIFNDSSILFPIPMRLFGVRVVAWRRDLGFWHTATKRLLLSFAGKLTTRIIANSKAVASSVRTVEKVTAERIEVIYNGVETTVSQTPDNSCGRADTETLVIGIVANLRPLKRIEDAIRALAHVLNSKKRALLLIAGEDRPGRHSRSHMGELQGIVDGLQISEYVRFLGATTNSRSMISRCDICLLCSETEGFSNSLLEYLVEGKLVIASDIEACREVIEDGKTGFLYPVGDDAALARRIIDVLDKPRDYKRIGANARTMVVARFSLATMIESHQRLYSEVVSEN